MASDKRGSKQNNVFRKLSKACKHFCCTKGVQLSRNKASLSRPSGIKLEDKQSVEADLPSGKQQDAESQERSTSNKEVVSLKKKETRLLETL